MNRHFPWLLFLLLLFEPIVLTAQEDTTSTETNVVDETPPLPKQYYLLSPRATVTVPLPLANKSFRKSFVGVYELCGDLNIYFLQGAFIGVNYDYGLLKIAANKIPNYTASMTENNVGVNIGGDFYLDEKNRIVFSTAITIGNNWTKYFDLTSKDPTKQPINTKYTTAYLKPEGSIYLLIDPNFGVGFNVSYYIYNHNFDPYELRLNDYAAYGDNNSGRIQYVSLGFGFYYNLIPSKNKKPNFTTAASIN